VALAREQSHPDLVDGFSTALQQERKHLAMIQNWYEEAVGLGAEGRANVDHSTTCAATPGAALAEPTCQAAAPPRRLATSCRLRRQAGNQSRVAMATDAPDRACRATYQQRAMSVQPAPPLPRDRNDYHAHGAVGPQQARTGRVECGENSAGPRILA
jgi:hypothetical protein